MVKWQDIFSYSLKDAQIRIQYYERRGKDA